MFSIINNKHLSFKGYGIIRDFLPVSVFDAATFKTANKSCHKSRATNKIAIYMFVSNIIPLHSLSLNRNHERLHKRTIIQGLRTLYFEFNAPPALTKYEYVLSTKLSML